MRTSNLLPAETKAFNGLIIGGTLTNVGAGEIHLYRGISTKGNPIIVHSGEQFGIIKGFSTITVINPSTLETAKFTALTAP